MSDDHPRLIFRCDAATLAQVQALARHHDQSLSQICRDAIALLLANLPRYEALLSARVTQRYAPPTPEQQAAFEIYRAQL
jgi:hypothetical protein